MPNIFLRAEWRKLAMANYVVDPAVLLPCVPKGTELDLWHDRCYVSLVGFMFLNTKVKGIKVPFHVNFEEVNLRFYVRHFDGQEWKRGVVFIQEIVPKPALTFVANAIYGEKYVTRRMKHAWSANEHCLKVVYQWKQHQWNSFSVSAQPSPIPIATGSEEEFITEHYWGYTSRGNMRTDEYGVEHPRWEVYPVQAYTIDVDFATVYGSNFSFLQNATPQSVFLAEGSPIIVRAGKRL